MADTLLSELLSWWRQLVAMAASIHIEALVFTIIWSSLVALISLVWVCQRSNRLKGLRKELLQTHEELNDVRTKYQREVEWRMAAERYEAKGASST
jgi:hypothetical protein